jgi:hypothetical protein
VAVRDCCSGRRSCSARGKIGTPAGPDQVPMAGVVAVIVNPTSPAADSQLKNLEPAAEVLGLQFHALYATAR